MKNGRLLILAVFITACFTACDNLAGPVRWPTYTVVYHANDGTDRTETRTYRYGTTEYLNGMFPREGHTIYGWATSPDGEVRARTRAAVNGLVTMVDQTVNLFAVWLPNGYTVVYDPNGGYGYMPPSARVFGRPENLRENAFVKYPYVFHGWAGSPGGYVWEFSDGAGVTSLTCENGGTVTLYAMWGPQYIAVSFAAGGGQGPVPDPRIVAAGSDVPLPGAGGLYRAGYTFAGWRVGPPQAGEVLGGWETFALRSVRDVTLYAVWSLRNFVITFNANGVEGTPPGPQTVYAGNHVILPGAGTLLMYGYTFGGWNTEADGSGRNLGAGEIFAPTGNLTLYAVWHPVGTGILGVIVEPSTANVPLNRTRQFTHMVQGAAGISQNVTWTVEPEGAATIVDGLLTLAAGVSLNQQLTVTATAVGTNPPIYGSSIVTVSTHEPDSIVITQGATINIERGVPLALTATVEPSEASGAVTWSIVTTPVPPGVTLSGNGELTTEYPVSNGDTFIVRAEVTGHPGVSALIAVTVTVAVAPIGVEVMPRTASIPRGGTWQFNADVLPTGAPQDVEWTVAAAPGSVLGDSTINPQGQLMIGAGASGTLIVTATIPGTDMYDTATVTVAKGEAYLAITLANLRDPLVQEIQGPDINLRHGNTGTVTVTAAPGQPFHSVIWLIGARQLTTADGVSVDGASLTVGYAIHGNRLGTHRVTVRVEVLRNGIPVPYSRSIAFEVGTWLQ